MRRVCNTLACEKKVEEMKRKTQLRQARDCGNQVESSWQERLMVDDVGGWWAADGGAGEVEGADASSSNWMMEGADVPCFNPPSKGRP